MGLASRRERLLGGSRVQEGVQGLPEYAPSCGFGQLVMQVRGRGWGQIGSCSKTREVVEEALGPERGFGGSLAMPRAVDLGS